MKQFWGQFVPSNAVGSSETASSRTAISGCRQARTRFRFSNLLMLTALFLFALTPMAFAQVITGDVVGTVSDPNGSVVPNATISIRNLDTHALRTAQSSSNGDFAISLLPTGHYSITVEAAGFKKYKVDDLTLSAGDRTRIDAKLGLGAATETIEVQSAAPMLQTDSSSVGGLIGDQSVQDLPLNGRNITNLVTQQVGVNGGMPGNITSGARPDDRRQTSSVSANGQLEYFNSNMLDGIDNNERFYGLGGIKPSIDGIEEVKVDTNNFPAEEGRSAGAVVTVVTKAGGNAFHGTLYEYFRNDIFDTKDAFLPSGFRKPEYRQNQFGGSVGGPIVKDKTFFFFDIEQLRIVQAITSPEQTVPDAADRAFVAGLPAAVGSPAGKAIFNLFPESNVPGTNFYVSSPAKTQNSTSMDARVDHHFSANDSVFARYSYNPVTSTFPCFFPKTNGFCPGGAGFIANGAFPGTNTTGAQGAQINYTHVFSSSLVMELRAGFMRLKIDSETIDKGTDAGNKLGIPNSNPTTDANATGMPGFHFLDGSADLGDQIAYPIKNINNTYQYNGDVIYNHGAHNVKVGAALLRRQLNYLQEFTAEGWYFFAPIFTAPGASAPSAPLTMAMGIPAVFLNRQNMYGYDYFRSWEPSVFAQDDWHLRPWLTLNLGVRYDIFTPFTEAKNRIANFDVASLAMTVGGTGGVKTSRGNIAPRTGFSAQLPHGYVLRGGFGISYYPGDFSSAITLFNPPYANPVSCSPIAGSCGAGGVGTLDVGPPSSPAYQDPSIIYSASAGGLNLVAKQKSWRSAYMEQYNLIVQKQVGANAITVGYVGSLGRRQSGNGAQDMNMPIPDAKGTYAVVSGAVPHYYASQLPGISAINYYSDEYTSNFNALQMVFERRAAKGLTFNANYTLAHGLNNWSGYDSGGASSQWRGNPRYDYGNSDTDIRHRIAATFTYELPFGKSFDGAKAIALKGWSVSSSTYWQTGLPFTVVDSNKPGGAFGDFNMSIRTNVVPGQGYYPAKKSINAYINPNAFTPAWTGDLTATTFTLGNEHSNQLNGPHMRQADLSLYKTQVLRDNLKLQFRAESYNISNTPNFAPPSNDLNALGTTFGKILNTQSGTSPRQFQFALKLLF